MVLLTLLLLASVNMQVLPLRLGPGEELKSRLNGLGLQAGVVVTCVGSLETATVRFADLPAGTFLQGPFEIVSLVGTLSPDGDHLHISLSDRQGHTFGGHLMEGRVYTTCEVVVGVLDCRFRRVHDPATGYPELKVEP